MADTKVLNQQDPRWADVPVGNDSTLLMWAIGCFLTMIAQAIGTTPDVVNNALKAVDGFADNGAGMKTLVIWSKIAQAFPGITAVFKTPYNNDDVVAQIAAGNKVLCEVSAKAIGGSGIHAVLYIGNHQCYDPWTGTIRPTSDFGTPSAYVVISGKWENQAQTTAAATGGDMYTLPSGKQVDLANRDSNIVCAKTFDEVVNQKLFTRTEFFDQFVNGVCDQLGITPTTSLATVQQAYKDRINAAKASVVVNGTAPTTIPATSISTTPPPEIPIGDIQTPAPGQKTVVTIKPDPNKPANVIVSAKTVSHKVAIDYIEEWFAWLGKKIKGGGKK
jgi:hypothetical protein